MLKKMLVSGIFLIISCTNKPETAVYAYGSGGLTVTTTTTVSTSSYVVTASNTENITTTTSNDNGINTCDSFPECPKGFLISCDGKGYSTECCENGDVKQTCARNSGILIYGCDTDCDTQECTMSQSGI